MSFFVPQFFKEQFTLKRYEAGAYVDGKWAPGAIECSSLRVDSSIQPVRERELQYLPEGQRNREAIVIYTATEIRTLNEGANLPPDIVEARGKEYEVARVWYHTTPWTHYKAICFLVDGK